MSTIKVDTITDTSGNSSPIIKGAVLQVQYFQLTTSQTETISSANADQAISNFTVNITPKSSSSIIKLDAQIFFETANAVHSSLFFFFRDSTKLAHSASSGSRKTGISVGSLSYYDNDADSTPDMVHMGYFDTPNTTSAIAYKLGCIMSSTNNLFINRTVADTDSNSFERGTSYISATEIGG